MSGHEKDHAPEHPGWEVPRYETRKLGKKSKPHLVVIPVINEGERIRGQLARMAELKDMADVIIADGGSTDGSLDDEELLKAARVKAVLTKRGPGKLSAQLRMGFAWGLSQGYEGFISIDGNGKDGVDAIPSFVQALWDGMDFIQGSRYVAGGRAINTPKDREIGLKLLHAPLVSIAAGHRFTDTTNGFRGYSAQLLTDERLAIFRDVFDSYNLHYYIAIKAARLGFKVTELPVTRAYPDAGPTPSKIGGFSGKAHVLKQLLLTVAGAYDPPKNESWNPRA